ncbi:MAG: hypothetical protein HOF35_13065 [Bacteroidetes bacterium]|nr:hypothetical protein [Bacteroidota bacterium]MBT5531040.1 hypothetical protein [Cytophagia bacterium]
MKSKIMRGLLMVCALFVISNTFAQDKISPYYKIGDIKGSISTVSATVVSALQSKDFTIYGKYHPAANADYYVIAFSWKDLYNVAINIKDRGLLGAMLKVSLIHKDGSVEVSLLNPDYMFNAYYRENYSSYSSKLNIITDDVKTALKSVGTDFTAFGGQKSASDLHKYHYMMGMPYFTDPVELATFNSFNEGLEIIKKNLQNKVGNTAKVYTLTFPKQEVAVFGIALNDKNTGEAHFLPIIGEKHIACMPYEIILEGSKATMLHGRYRIALYWPELTMGTFTKIMSTPGDVENAFKKVVGK